MDILAITTQFNSWHLLGHDWAVDMLREHLKSDQARHAYLFSGPTGVGRRTLALRFIQGMNCPNSSTPGQGCLLDTCRTCRQIMDMQHADLKVIRVPDGKSEILIDQVRELQAFLMLSPYEAPYKVGLLLNFERATVQAQNALLKTLEEAPPRARILLTSDSAESLLPTIVSRCEPLRLRPLPLGQIAASLISRGVDGGQARLIDHLSAGRFGYAIQLTEDNTFIEKRAEVIGELIGGLQANLRKRFKLVEEALPKKGDLSHQRQEAREILLIWQSFFRDILLRQANSVTQIMNLDYTDEIDRLAARYTVHHIEGLISACDLGLERIDRYCNIRLVMESVVEGFG